MPEHLGDDVNDDGAPKPRTMEIIASEPVQAGALLTGVSGGQPPLEFKAQPAQGRVLVFTYVVKPH